MTPTLYEGTKRLHATQMTRGEYNAYRGWETPVGESSSDAGYLVEYQDGGKANDARHAGYISWSPADVFERTYKPVAASKATDCPELEIQAKASNGPRVTPQAVKDEIVSEWYINGATGVVPDDFQPPVSHDSPLNLLTICVLQLRNGYTVHGVSACASPENFNAEIGRRIARENAEREIWPLLGFRLRDQLAYANFVATN